MSSFILQNAGGRSHPDPVSTHMPSLSFISTSSFKCRLLFFSAQSLRLPRWRCRMPADARILTPCRRTFWTRPGASLPPMSPLSCLGWAATSPGWRSIASKTTTTYNFLDMTPKRVLVVSLANPGSGFLQWFGWSNPCHSWSYEVKSLPTYLIEWHILGSFLSLPL